MERVVEDFQKREEVLDFGKIEKVVGGHLHGDFIVAEDLGKEAGSAGGRVGRCCWSKGAEQDGEVGPFYRAGFLVAGVKDFCFAVDERADAAGNEVGF